MALSTGRSLRWWERPIPGEQRWRPLSLVHALHSAGNTFFTISLAGSLFFNVTVDASRSRILLYLVLTMAPFAVVGTMVGPVIDRVRGGHRGVLMVALGARAVLALLLASQLKSVLLYPEAFLFLLLAKTYTVARNSLLPGLVLDRENLVLINSRLARQGTAAGALAGVIGIVVLDASSAAWVLRLAAVVFVLGAAAAARVPRPLVAEASPRAVESAEIAGPGIRQAFASLAALEATMGFLLFHLGFALKAAGEPAWFLGLALAATSAGGFAGTYAAPRLRRRVAPPLLLTGVLLAPSLLAAIASLRVHRATIIMLNLVVGLAFSVGRRAFDEVVQTQAPHARRGRTYALLETRLELCWVLGALVAVVARASDWIGVGALALSLAAAGTQRLIRQRRSVALGHRPAAELATRLLDTADSLAARGDDIQALLVAMAAVEAACPARSTEVERLRNLVRAARSDSLSAEEAQTGLALGHTLVGQAIACPTEAVSSEAATGPPGLVGWA